MLDPGRFLGGEKMAREFYEQVAGLPLVCPHGHVDPALLADPDKRFEDPVELLIRPDHYLVRMLYSQGIEPARLGIGAEADRRQVWRLFAEHYYLFAGTPTGIWLDHVLHEVFGLEQRPERENADRVYDQIQERLDGDFQPRQLYQRFGIEVLCTTDAATDSLEHHQRMRDEGWGRVLPTFRPDRLLNPLTPGWADEVEALARLTGQPCQELAGFVEALSRRRRFFQSLGAVASDHGTVVRRLAPAVDAVELFGRALEGRLEPEEAERFEGHMLCEMARLSIEDGLVMQLHPGSYRNHNGWLFEHYGPDRGADIPMAWEFTRGLQPLLSLYGNEPALRLVVFTLDESTYSRELAPLAGHYPCLLLGPPWWFHDSPRGMARYFDRVMETAGLYNTAGFNDDTRAFLSIPARHDLWRRCSCRWLAGLVADGAVGRGQAEEMAEAMAVGLARRAYRLEPPC